MQVTWGQVALIVLGIFLSLYITDWVRKNQNQDQGTPTQILTNPAPPAPPAAPRSAASYVDQHHPRAASIDD